MFPSCTCTVHRWEQPTASCRVKPYCMCQGREQHPMRMKYKPMGHRTQFVMALFCQLLKQQNITTISVFSVLSGRRAKRWATSQSIFRCVYCWLLGWFFFFCFSQESQLQRLREMLRVTHTCTLPTARCSCSLSHALFETGFPLQVPRKKK